MLTEPAFVTVNARESVPCAARVLANVSVMVVAEGYDEGPIVMRTAKFTFPNRLPTSKMSTQCAPGVAEFENWAVRAGAAALFSLVCMHPPAPSGIPIARP